MAFHESNLGSFGDDVQSDINGYVPTEDTGPWELTYDHGTEETHDRDGNITDYGKWWESDGFPGIKAAAIEATEKSEEAIGEWQTQ